MLTDSCKAGIPAILVFGTGKICGRYRSSLERMNILAFLDNDIMRQGASMWGKKVCAPQEGIGRFAFDKIFIMTVHIHEVMAQLLAMGVDRELIDNYMSIEDALGESVFKDKQPKYSYEEVRRLVKKTVAVFEDDFSVLEIFKYISRKLLVVEEGNHLPAGVDVIAYHGLNMTDHKAEIYRQAVARGVPVIFFEDGFLRSIVPCGFAGCDEYAIGRSVMLDGRGIYINAFSESELERVLNSDFALNQAEADRADRLMGTLVEKRLSKYNNQPMPDVAIGRKEVSKVLVIDQVPGDKSIKYGMAGEETFALMLEAAIRENPQADILVKCHPATQKSHYKDAGGENVFMVDYPVNPIALLTDVNKVYVCTSQMGFEALMCGKEVHVFGMPFYAGWGVTYDRMTCSRRKKRRTVREIFYAAYVLLPIYISTRKQVCCEIEDVIEDLLALRDEYHAQWRQP